MIVSRIAVQSQWRLLDVPTSPQTRLIRYVLRRRRRARKPVA